MPAHYYHSLFVKEGISAGSTSPLESGKYLIGYSPGSTLLIESSGVMQRGPSLLFLNSHYFTKKRGSIAGSLVNEAQILNFTLPENHESINIRLNPGMMDGGVHFRLLVPSRLHLKV